MAAGDGAAVEPLLPRAATLHAAARRATGRDEMFCLDVVQDAVLRVIRTVRPVESEAAARSAWLRLVVRTAAYDLLRREQRQPARNARRGRRSSAVPGPSMATTPTRRPRAPAWLRDELAHLDPRASSGPSSCVTGTGGRSPAWPGDGRHRRDGRRATASRVATTAVPPRPRNRRAVLSDEQLPLTEAGRARREQILEMAQTSRRAGGGGGAGAWLVQHGGARDGRAGVVRGDRSRARGTIRSASARKCGNRPASWPRPPRTAGRRAAARPPGRAVDGRLATAGGASVGETAGRRGTARPARRRGATGRPGLRRW